MLIVKRRGPLSWPTLHIAGVAFFLSVISVDIEVI